MNFTLTTPRDVPAQTRPENERRAQYLPGFDLLRGIAAFAVIFLHAGLVENAPLTPGVVQMRAVFDFAVPFFLLTSFYFALRGLKPDFCLSLSLRKSARRILIPYLVWTLLYLGLRVVKLLLLHQSSRMNEILSDPVAVFLLGDTGIQLYFLPLLLTGLTLLYCLAPSVRRLSLAALSVLWLAAILLYQWLVVSGKVFHVEANPAYARLFHQNPLGDLSGPVEFLIAIASYALRCLPLILLAVLLNRCLKPPAGSAGVTVLVLAGSVLLLRPLLPSLSTLLGAEDEIFSLGAFLLAWALSFVLGNSVPVARLGTYSFGIYLCHQVFLELLQVIGVKRHTHLEMQGLPFTLGITALTFVASWAAVALAEHSFPLVRSAFGLQERRASPAA